MPSVPYFCDNDGMDEFDEAWEQSFLDSEARVNDDEDKDDKDDKEFEKKSLTRECKCCTMR